MKSIQHQQLNLPPHAPVMFLPSVTLLPHVLLPLFIFEPRYRQMLAHCLEQQRMFCVALLQPGISEVRSAEDFFPVAGVGLVRACVGHEDGTSHLVLQGLARVALRGFVQEQPFRIAEMRELLSEPAIDPDTAARCEQIRRLAAAQLPVAGEEASKVKTQLSEIDDAGMLCDIVAHTFLQGAHRQQETLEELSVDRRLKLVLRSLKEQMAE